MAKRELTELRARHAKFFQLDNGHRQVVIQNGQHYFDRDTGRFEEFKANVEDDLYVPGFSKRFKGQHWSRFARGGVWRFGFGQGMTITYTPENAANADPSALKNVVTYSELWPNVDLKLTAFPEGIKEDIIIKASGARNAFTFKAVLQGVTLRQSGQLISVVDGSGTPVGQVRCPTAVDANGQTGEVRLTLTSDSITIEADTAWLSDPARAFPVTIDPTTVIQPDAAAGKDTYLDAGNPTINYGTDTVINVNYGAKNGLIEFSLSSVPAGAGITGATLSLYVNDISRGGTIKAAPVTEAWDELQATWNNRVTGTAWTTAGGSYDNSKAITTAIANASAVWFDQTVTDMVKEWFAGTTVNYGFWMGDLNTLGTNVQFISSDSASADYRPKLTVTYTSPPTVSVTTPNGTQVSPTQVSDEVTPALAGVYSSADSVNMAYRQHQVLDELGNVVWDSGKTAETAVPGATVTVAVPNGYLKYGQKYQWRWMAWDVNGGYSAWSSAGWFKCVLSAPTGVTATADATAGKIRLAWNTHPGENFAGYRVYRRKSGETTWNTLISVTTLTSPSDEIAATGVTYQYKVTALASDGYEGPDSSTVEASVTISSTFIGDIELDPAPQLTSIKRPFNGRLSPVIGSNYPDIQGQLVGRQYEIEGAMESRSAMVALEAALSTKTKTRYVDPWGEAFYFRVVGDLEIRKWNIPDKYHWRVRVAEVE